MGWLRQQRHHGSRTGVRFMRTDVRFMVSPCYSYAAPMFAGFGMPALVTLWLECAPSWRAMHLPEKQETWQVLNLTWLTFCGLE
jgi:hypothetical protein